jgi:hypothetical protein
MPRYDYICPQNNQIVEVSHPLGQPLLTWGELCERAQLDPGDTPLNAPVDRLLSATSALLGKTSAPRSAAEAAPAAPVSSCCAAGGCHRH